MNIIKYKNIDELLQKKDVYLAQEIDSDQLKLISKGFIPTKFNIGINDVLEFVLYDISNNVLPQESFGNARYIKGDSIKNYLLASNNPSDAVYEGGGFVVDIKKLIKEAGYNTGYYRVQINFINNRVGSDYPTDKMWIQEISSTRLEMRLLPFNNFNESNPIELDVKNDLNQSYDSFVLGKFSGDEVYAEIYNILDSIKASDVANIMKTVLTQATIEKLSQEFNILGGFDLFYSRVLEDMKSSVINELLYRNSTIGSNDFGRPISDTIRNKISQKDYNYYTKSEIIDLLNLKFKESVAYHLPKRTLDETLRVDAKTQESLDLLNDVVQTLETDQKFQLPQIELQKITPTPIPATPPFVTPTTTPIPVVQLLFTNGPTVIVTETTAQITFTNNEPATSVITFANGVCPKEGCILTPGEISLGKRILLSELIPNTEYIFTVESKTTDGKSVSSIPISFSTLPIINQDSVFDPYVPISGGGGGKTYTYINDSDGNPDTVDGSVYDLTQRIK